ncbi:hypothetical protein SAMN05421640_1991 [Ekhidna lutea]|uniref:N-acetyltransferase domain-containing protein n=1 Tax=Ekhidna lutea TaxID=447679 RepID=A0A239J6Q3_EKHLU|nr:hypothetical protein [Ekhidna lutea]SNT00933.1 hypothetical protein SAMN05421640_1991 [Ekhidna lutea]
MTPIIHFIFDQHTEELKKEVIDFWLKEKALNEEQANQRASQIAFIAREREGQLIGVSTIMKRKYEPIGKVFWLFRAFVAQKYRQQGVVLQLISEAKTKLNNRFNAGKDPDVIGILLKVQSPILMKHFPQATWPRTQFHYVGIEDGCHMRISYFDGAMIE